MASCERCWSEANYQAFVSGGSVSEHYSRIITERDEAGLTCTPREQAGQFWDEAEQRDTRKIVPGRPAFDIGTSNARQSDYWQRVGGHDPEGYQDYDEDEE